MIAALSPMASELALSAPWLRGPHEDRPLSRPRGGTHLGRVARLRLDDALEGDLFGDRRDTGEPADVAKLLAPLVPVDILCIGLNYRKHAEEGKQAIPEWPVLFMKTSARSRTRATRSSCRRASGATPSITNASLPS